MTQATIKTVSIPLFARLLHALLPLVQVYGG